MTSLVEAPSRWRAWAVALRPLSLPVAIAPVLVGAAAGQAHAGRIDLLAALLALLAALLMQLLTNLQNDVGYTLRAGRTLGDKTGLPRATAMGWLTPAEVKRVIAALVLIAVLLGLGLVWLRGWPVLVLGLASLLAALAYMGGPWPIAYTPLGELTVFVFFGLVAVLGTDWLVSGSVATSTWLAASAVGCLAASVLAINNYRDAPHDQARGRLTFAVRWGPAAARGLLALLLLGPFVLVLVLAAWQHRPWCLLPWVVLPSAWQLRAACAACAPGDPGLNPFLLRAFRLQLGFATALALGLLL